jgi:hypothetical protein
MAYDEAIRNITMKADSSLAGYTGVPGTPGAADPNYGNAQYRVVKIVGAKTVGRASAAADATLCLGICQSKPQVVGEGITVAIRGISKVFAGAAFSAGTLLSPDATGRLVASAGGANVVAIAIEDASGANTLTSALIRCN